MDKSQEHWLCLDCRLDLLPPGRDYYMLRHRLWRALVPRAQRHGMLCLRCVEARLGRGLQPSDFRPKGEREEPGDAEDQPMALDDYGVLDGLRGPALTVVDDFLLAQARPRPRSIRAIVHRALEDPSPDLPAVTDLFYAERIEYLFEIGRLVVVEDKPEWWDIRVRTSDEPPDQETASGNATRSETRA